jgi:CelD/BcsL family acetyltransferase involved in cellulose biosynthesis
MARNDSVAAVSFPLRHEGMDAVPRRAVAEAEWRPLSALGATIDEWRDLVGRALEPNVFYDPAFALAAAPVFGANAGAVLVRRAGKLIALFPGRVERRYGVMATLTGWTHPYAPLGVPLVDRSEADAAIAAFLDFAGTDGPQLVLLPMIACDGAFAAALRRVLARRGGTAAEFGGHARALLAPAQDRAGYLEHALPHKKLKELRRQRRRLADSEPVTLASAHAPKEVATALGYFLALEASGWKGRAGTATAERPPIRAFMERAVTALAADGHARVDRLKHGARTLAVAITLRSGDASWFWKIAYDEAYARASPGVQISLDLTEALLADATIARADSCATADHPMIDHLWRERLALADLLIAPGRDALAAFHVACRLEALRRAAFSTAKRVRNAIRG